MSRIEYCSSLLYNLHASSIATLNRISSLSIRSIFNIILSYHSFTDFFHILQKGPPIKKRYLSRLLFITHKSIYSSTPSIIFELLLIHYTTHDTRSPSSIYLVIPQLSSLTLTNHHTNIIPSRWNVLPSSVRCILLSPFSILISNHIYR